MIDYSKFPLANRFLNETGMNIDEALSFFEKLKLKQKSEGVKCQRVQGS